MNISLFTKQSDFEWRVELSGKMLVPAIIYADKTLIQDMDEKVYEQVTNVATLPGIVKASYAMPDAHWGYGFPIGGVAAFDPKQSGIVSAGGVGFDISCLSEDAEVLYAHGYKRRISTMSEHFSQYRVEVQDFDTRRTTNANLVYFFRKKPDTEVYVLKTATDRTITATADHPFYTPGGMTVLEKIQPGDRVALYGFEGVHYEEPSAETILSEDEMVKFLFGYNKGVSGHALTQLLNHLKQRYLLPLCYNNPAIPYLLKLIGFVMGDGTATLFKDGSAATAFYGKKEDLEEIRADISQLRFSAIPIYSRPRDHSINTFYGQVEFRTLEHMTRCNSTALTLLLAALGCPIGNKTNQAYRVPGWIRKAPLWQKRLFLSAYLGAEMSTPEPVLDRNFYCPTISASKEISLIANAREFLADISELLAEFGVATQKISRVEDDYERKGGGRSDRYRLILSSKPEDLIALYGRIGFSYNHQKMARGLQIIHYLKCKSQVLERHISVATEARRMHEECGLGAKSIHRAMGSPSDIALRFIERSIYESRKTPPRVWDSFETFEAFSKEATEGLGESGMVWDTVISKEVIEPPDWVYDFTVNHPSHNFIANGFVVSNCGVRNLHTGLTLKEIEPVKKELADALYRKVPVGVGSTGRLHLGREEMNAMLSRGAQWAVERGYGMPQDLERVEEHGCMEGARPEEVSEHAKKRQQDEMGTLGSGNHYLEIQHVVEVFDTVIADAYGIAEGDILVSIHCGSRGLGHQIGTEFLKKMAVAAAEYGIYLPDRELACAPIESPIGQAYLGAMRAAINCALANRQIITHLAREAFAEVIPDIRLPLLYDVSHNTCKIEEHVVDGKSRRLFVHRKGATRAFGPGHPDIPPALRSVGQPVLIGGSMGTASYILAGTREGMTLSFGSACHGAGRSMSRNQALKRWKGRDVIDQLASRGILIRSPSYRGVAEEAPGAYKDVTAVVDAADRAKLARKVAKLEPLACIKG
jgi:tRNA-splicing ligase RtcB